MRSQATWDFAQKYHGRWCRNIGCFLLFPAVVALLIIKDKNDSMTLMTTVNLIIGIVGLIFAVIITEIALRKNFDKNGNPKMED
ncbi:MAG: hypothetical protein FWC40_05435 [Proteobacteria bacterium]|nr:hypothetical protein [Pseudomonadota bacterium]